MLPRAIAAACFSLALPGLAAAECSTRGMAGEWLLTSDLDVACRIAVAADGGFATSRCNTGAEYAGRLAADDRCAVDLVLARKDGVRLDTLRGIGWLAFDRSRVDGYYIEPGAGAIGLSLIRQSDTN